MPTQYKVPELNDFIWQQSIKNRTTNTPPSANKGDRYIVGSSPSGDWSTKSKYIATYNGSIWDFTLYVIGMICYITDENLYYFYNGSDWIAYNANLAPKTNFSKSFVITNPTSLADFICIWRTPTNITITGVHLYCEGAAIVGHLTINGSGVDSSTDITGIVDTNVNDDGSLSNPSASSGDKIGWRTTSATVGAIRAIITFDYTLA